MGPRPGLRRYAPRGPGDSPKQRRMGRGEADEVIAAVQRRPQHHVTPPQRRERLVDEVTTHARTVGADDHDPSRAVRKVAREGVGEPRAQVTAHLRAELEVAPPANPPRPDPPPFRRVNPRTGAWPHPGPGGRGLEPRLPETPRAGGGSTRARR